VQVREIDPPTAPVELLHALYRIELAAMGELIPLEPTRTVENAISFWRNPPEGETRRYWIAEESDGAVGSAGMYVHGPKFVYVELYVLPESRRRGVGTALLDAVCAAAREEGLAAFWGHHGDVDGAAFARTMGAVDDDRDVRSMLRLRDADLPQAVVPDGYSLRSWIGRTPAELVESYAAARQAMNDAPMPSGSEAEEWTVAAVRRSEETGIRRGREVRVTVAIDPSGDIVSFTDVRVSPAPSIIANTDDTGTLARARGLGLARAVKLESLRRLRDDRPDVELVNTMNAEHNTAMRHINTRIGFVPTATLTTTVLTL
jgi:GNAT superfamily N-acetyltransferase